MKVNLGDIEEMLLIPLWGRAKFTQEYLLFLNDQKAVELVEQIEYDFPTLDKTLGKGLNLLYAARAKQFDDKIRAYIAQHPNLGYVF